MRGPYDLLQKVKFHAKHTRVPPMKSNWIDFQTPKIQRGYLQGGGELPGANRSDSHTNFVVSAFGITKITCRVIVKDMTFFRYPLGIFSF